MLLKNKTAIIYGASPSIGGAVALAFAREGANVFVTGRSKNALNKLVDEIVAAGGNATAAIVNAVDEKEVQAHIDMVLREAGSVAISFNAIGLEDKQGVTLADMLLQDFIRPISTAMQTQFITATAAARIMIKQGNGVILSITATPAGIGYAMVGGFGPACAAIESFSRDLAAEVGVHGVRVVNIRSAGSRDSRPFKEAMAADPKKTEGFLEKMKGDTMLKVLPMMADIANVAVFLGSSMAAKITGVNIDVTVGTTTALNYKMTESSFVEK